MNEVEKLKEKLAGVESSLRAIYWMAKKLAAEVPNTKPTHCERSKRLPETVGVVTIDG